MLGYRAKNSSAANSTPTALGSSASCAVISSILGTERDFIPSSGKSQLFPSVSRRLQAGNESFLGKSEELEHDDRRPRRGAVLQHPPNSSLEHKDALVEVHWRGKAPRCEMSLAT